QSASSARFSPSSPPSSSAPTVGVPSCPEVALSPRSGANFILTLPSSEGPCSSVASPSEDIAPSSPSSVSSPSSEPESGTPPASEAAFSSLVTGSGSRASSLPVPQANRVSRAPAVTAGPAAQGRPTARAAAIGAPPAGRSRPSRGVERCGRPSSAPLRRPGDAWSRGLPAPYLSGHHRDKGSRDGQELGSGGRALTVRRLCAADADKVTDQ